MSQPWLAYLPVYLAISLPILAALAILVGRIFQPDFRGQWLIAVLSILATLGLVIYLRPHADFVVPLLRWEPVSIFPHMPLLLIDNTSWAYSLAIAALGVAILFTAPARFTGSSWIAWFGTLSFTGLGLLAVWAGNPMTLLIAWTSLDVLELIVQFNQVLQSSLRERLVAAFSARVAGTIMLILSVVVASIQGYDFSFQSIPASITPLIVLAAGLRLGVLPVQSPLYQEIRFRRGVGTALRMVPASASLVLLTRTAAIGVQSGIGDVFLVLAGLAALYSGLAWLNSADEIGGRSFWIQGFAALAVAAAVRGQPSATLAWGLALFLSGGMLFLYFPRHPRLDVIVYLGLLTASALPMTPTWPGTLIFSIQNQGAVSAWQVVSAILFFLSFWLLLLGYLRHLARPVEPAAGIQPWIWLVYVPGLLLLPFIQSWLGWMNRIPMEELPVISWWVGPSILIILVGSLIWRQRARRFASVQENLRGRLAWGATFWGQVLSLSWVYRLLWTVYRQTGRVLYGITRLLEGEGGLMWALLILILIYSLFLPGNTLR